MEHARVLAESGDTFPPIIVDRATMRVIDGMHRLCATVIRGKNDIDVQFFDGDLDDAFILAVKANIAHGLPLSLADRTAAAARIINIHPEWSDGIIASIAGLAAKTVGAIRRRSTGENTESNRRLGRDGRVRPLSTAEGRKTATEFLTHKPDASIREIASAARISLGTAQDVRDRLRRGENPILPRHQNAQQRERQPTREAPTSSRDSEIGRPVPTRQRQLTLHYLAHDPTLRLNNTGRILLRLLRPLSIDTEEWKRLAKNVPAHCVPMVSEAARACAKAWQDFAKQLERR